MWGESDHWRRIHTIAWETICQPKTSGGLGLHSTRAMNDAFLMKAAWRFCQNREALWASVIHKKYGCGDNILPKINPNKVGSNFWKGLCKVWDSFSTNLVWRLGNGESITFWLDCWNPSLGPLLHHVVVPLSDFDTANVVSNYVAADGSWDESVLRNMLIVGARLHLCAMLPPS